MRKKPVTNTFYIVFFSTQAMYLVVLAVNDSNSKEAL